MVDSNRVAGPHLLTRDTNHTLVGEGFVFDPFTTCFLCGLSHSTFTYICRTDTLDIKGLPTQTKARTFIITCSEHQLHCAAQQMR